MVNAVWRKNSTKGYTMKKAMVIVSVLVGIGGLNVFAHAAQQKVATTTDTVAIRAKVLYRGSPKFTPINGTTISYATNTPQEVINIDDLFYLRMQGKWFVSGDAQGPWRKPQFVPKAVRAIVCSQQNVNPYDPSQLCALPWSTGLMYKVWKSF